MDKARALEAELSASAAKVEALTFTLNGTHFQCLVV